MKVLRLYEILIAFGGIPNEFKGLGSMRQNFTMIKAIRACVQKLLKPKMRVKLSFLVDPFLTGVYITLNVSKTMNNEDLVHVSSFFQILDPSII